MVHMVNLSAKPALPTSKSIKSEGKRSWYDKVHCLCIDRELEMMPWLQEVLAFTVNL